MFYKFDSERQDQAIGLLRDGYSRTAVAAACGISRQTLYDRIEGDAAFAAAVTAAEVEGVAEVEAALRDTALSGNPTAMIFYLCNRAPDRWQRDGGQPQRVEIAAEVTSARTMEIHPDAIDAIIAARAGTNGHARNGHHP